MNKTGSKILPELSNFLQTQFESAGSQVAFIAAFFRHTFKRGFEWNKFFNQCYLVGVKSLGLIGITGFILGFVMTLQSEPTMRDFGAESFVPGMVAISIIREIGPVIIALICAGKVASGMGAELASMKVSEQIDAMEVSGANPMQYLVVTRMLACIFMIPLLTLIGDALAIFGGFAASNINNNMTFTLYFTKAFSALQFSDLIPAVIKTIFFGFAIGFAGCYKGFTANNGTESVGVAANSAVVMASLWVIVLDAIAVQLTSYIVYS